MHRRSKLGPDHIIVIYATLVKNDNISRCFFHFFKILIFRVVRRVKGQKMVQNDKKFSFTFHISGTIHHMIVIYMVQMCEMIISLGVFFNAKILIFQFVKGLKGQKNDLKCWKFLSVIPYISGTIYHVIFVYGTHVCIKG